MFCYILSLHRSPFWLFTCSVCTYYLLFHAGPCRRVLSSFCNSSFFLAEFCSCKVPFALKLPALVYLGGIYLLLWYFAVFFFLWWFYWFLFCFRVSEPEEGFSWTRNVAYSKAYHLSTGSKMNIFRSISIFYLTISRLVLATIITVAARDVADTIRPVSNTSTVIPAIIEATITEVDRAIIQAMHSTGTTWLVGSVASLVTILTVAHSRRLISTEQLRLCSTSQPDQWKTNADFAIRKICICPLIAPTSQRCKNRCSNEAT